MDSLSPNTVLTDHSSTYLVDNKLNGLKDSWFFQESKKQQETPQVLFRRQDGTNWITIVRKPSGKVKGFLEKSDGTIEVLSTQRIPKQLNIEHINNARKLLANSSFCLRENHLEMRLGLKGGAKETLQTSQEILQSIINYIDQISACLLEIRGLSPNSNQYFNALGDLYRFWCGACQGACLLRENYEDTVCKKLTSINWKILSLAKECTSPTYRAHFITSWQNERYKKLFLKEVLERFHDSALVELRNIIDQFIKKANQTEKDLSSFFEMVGVLHSDYEAQYIISALDNYSSFRDADNSDSPENRARLLSTFIKIGEALKTISPLLLKSIGNATIQQTKKIRDFLCHPERNANFSIIKDFLEGAVSLKQFPMATTLVDLERLIADWLQNLQNIQQVIKLYNSSTSIDRLIALGNNSPLIEVAPYETKIATNPKKDSDPELKEKTSILERSFRNKFGLSFSQESNTKEFERKLNNPSGELGRINRSLSNNQQAYEKALKLQRSGAALSDDNNKLLQDYTNLLSKKNLWLEYKLDLEEVPTVLIIEREKSSLESFVRSLLFYIKKVKEYYENISHNTFPTTTNYNQRGFNVNKDHPILEFYQIMVGSLLRESKKPQDLLKPAESVKKIIPEARLKKSKKPQDLLRLAEFVKTISPEARGMLAHNMTKSQSIASSETLDTPAIFGQNSQEMIRLIGLFEIFLINLLNTETYLTSSGQQFNRITIKMDGNCLFRSIAQAMHGTQEKHQNVRREIVEWMRSNQPRLASFYAPETDTSDPDIFAQHIELMDQDRVWGGELEIRAAANRFNRTIIVYRTYSLMQDPTPYSPDVNHNRTASRPPIYLLHTGSHYELLTPIPPSLENPILSANSDSNNSHPEPRG